MYLPDTSTYTEKFVQEAHEATLHSGVGLMMMKVPEHHLRCLLNHVVKKCSFSGSSPSCTTPGLLPQDRTEG